MKWGKGSEKWEKLQGSAILVPELRPRAVFASPIYLCTIALRSLDLLGYKKSDANYIPFIRERPRPPRRRVVISDSGSQCRSNSRAYARFRFRRSRVYLISLIRPSIHDNICAARAPVWRVFVGDVDADDGTWSSRRADVDHQPGQRGWKYINNNVVWSRVAALRQSACFGRWFFATPYTITQNYIAASCFYTSLLVDCFLRAEKCFAGFNSHTHYVEGKPNKTTKCCCDFCDGN